jgi:tetratricopeptide (TPR) repeat protein
LDSEVADKQSFPAYLLRGNYWASVGENELAEKDYLHLTTLGQNGAGCRVLGRFYAQSGRVDDAVAVLDKGIRNHPDNLLLKEHLMQLLLAHTHPDKRARGREMLAQLQRLRPESMGLKVHQASILLREGTSASMKEARGILEDVVRREPTRMDAHLALIQAAVWRQDHRAARGLALRGLKANPRNVPLLRSKGRAEYALGDYETAAESARRILRSRPYDGQAHRLVIDATVGAKDMRALRQEQETLDQAVAARPADVQLRLANSHALEALDQTDEAVARLESFSRSLAGRQGLEVLLRLSGLHRAKEDLGGSGKALDRAKILSPDDLSVLGEEILLLRAKKEYDRIVKLVSARRRPGREYAGVLAVAASALAATGEPTHLRQAMVWYEEIAKLAPNSILPRLELASMAYRTGDGDRAVQIYRDVLELAPDHSRALNDLAWILAQAGRHEESLKLADKGVGLAPENYHLRDTRAFILSRLGRLEEARDDYVRCVELRADNPPAQAKALAHLGRTCAKLGQSDAARQHLQRALEIDGELNVFGEKERSEIRRELDALPAS